MKEFWLCFVPLFVAVDALGVLPMFTSLTSDLDQKDLKKTIRLSVATASAVSLLFLIGGKALLRLMGITVADFMIAGGILLFVISISDILRSEKVQRMVDPDSLGAVPIGVPLIAGPAVLTTSVLVTDQHGFWLSSAALIINILLAGIIFRYSDKLTAFMGKAGSKAFSKIASLFLAAIAIMLVRKGITSFF